jgi:hypothetical protein
VPFPLYIETTNYPKGQTKGALEAAPSFLAKEANMMKWGGYNRKGEERMKKLFSGKVAYYLLTIAGLALLLAESIKWSPEGRG